MPIPRNSTFEYDFRRPAMLAEELADQLVGAPDPADRSEIAHATAYALVHDGRAQAEDADLVQRIVELVDREGIDVVAELWAESASNTLPGTLWRLYLLREWTIRNAALLADRYRAGVISAEVSDAIAGARYTPGPSEIKQLTNTILDGAFTGEFDVALHRAAAFCRVISAGTAVNAERMTDDHPNESRALARNSASLHRMAADLDESADLWRTGRLD